VSDARGVGRPPRRWWIAAVLALSTACTGPVPTFDTAREVDRWVALWSGYDLDALPEVFVWDSTVTYLSSERTGLIQGADSVREHHRSMGFVEGGRAPTQELWVENVHATVLRSAVVVTALWLFGDRAGPAEAWQRGPMTAVYRWTDGTWRIMPKAVPNSEDSLALSAVGSSFATLARFDPASEKQRWLFKTP